MSITTFILLNKILKVSHKSLLNLNKILGRVSVKLEKSIESIKDTFEKWCPFFGFSKSKCSTHSITSISKMVSYIKLLPFLDLEKQIFYVKHCSAAKYTMYFEAVGEVESLRKSKKVTCFFVL